MEENRRISWSDLFIKVILVIIFILFTVWLLSLSNKNLSNSLNVLTDDIFSQNIEKMKDVGKEYFTIERLPKKIGDVKTLTLEEMYEKKLILEVKDKYGNSCDKEDSYISIEKYNNEYQMKVNLECGSEEDYIIVIMGCYDYCDTDICEIKDQVKQIEYEYKKSTGGSWTDYGKWSEWSKVLVSKTDYRQVETKKENKKYSYDKVITENLYEKIEATCPDGYKKTSDGTKCYKNINKNEYSDPLCPSVSGYTYTGRNGFTCNYSKNDVESKTATATCPSGYSKSGNSCVKTTTTNTEPICPSVSGYTYTGRNGFTCNYSRTVTSSNYTLSYVSTKTGSYVPADTSAYKYEQIDADYVYDCNNDCAFKWIYTYKVYKKNYGTTTEKITKTGSCTSGYSKSGNSCVKTNTTTANPSCPSVSGYTNTGRNEFTCSYSKSVINTATKIATCPSGYTNSGNSCVKTNTSSDYKNLVMICPKDYNLTEDSTKCYKKVNSTVKVDGTKEVTYYRYRIREYKGGTVDYKWSTSKEDKKLLDAGYKLTGRTR